MVHQIFQLFRSPESNHQCILEHHSGWWYVHLSSVAHFLFKLGKLSYYPPGASEISDNRLFGMFHSQTADHNKDVILKSFSKCDGIVRVLFATAAIGMGVYIYMHVESQYS